MTNDLNKLDVKYGNFDNFTFQLREIGAEVGDTIGPLTDVFDDIRNPTSVGTQELAHVLSYDVLAECLWAPYTAAANVLYSVGYQLENTVPNAFGRAGVLCSDAERAVIQALYDNVDTEGNSAAGAYASARFADEFYSAEVTRREEEQRQKDEQDKADAAYESALALALAACPEAAAEYQEALDAAAFEAALAEIAKHDPELAEKLRKEYEDRKKAREEAKKAAEEAAAEAENLAGELGDDALDGGGSDFGGSGFGDAGLDGASFGGGSGIGGDWGGSDFASDLLDDNIDTDGLLDAAAELGDAVGGTASDAVEAGLEAMADAADLGEGAGGIFGQYGEQLASLASAYGLQVAAVAGGAVALYATREQTTEAVAHVAEFMSTKCKPAVNDVMEQVRGAAKKTRVNLADAKSGVTAAARGERAGDLIG